MFVSVITTFLVGFDMCDQLVDQYVQVNGSFEKKQLPVFKAVENASTVAMASMNQRLMFGDQPWTDLIAKSSDNWTNILEFHDEIVKKHMEKVKSQSDNEQ